MHTLLLILTAFLMAGTLSLSCSGDSGVGPYPWVPGSSYTCAECSGDEPFLPNSSLEQCQVFATRFECEFDGYTEGSCSGDSLPSCRVLNCQIDPSSGCVP